MMLPEPDGLRPAHKATDSDQVHEDLAWILLKFATRVFADGAALTIHRDDRIELVCSTFRTDEWRATSEDIVSAAKLAHSMSSFFGQAPHSRVAWLPAPSHSAIGKVMTVEAAESGEIRLLVSALYRRSNFVQDIAAEQMAKKLTPVLAGYFRLWLYARHQERTLNALRAALDLSDVGIIILDSNGGVVGENGTATAMFDRKDVLKKSPRSLTAMARGDTAKLNAAIDQASVEGGPSALISLGRKGGGRPLMAVVSPILKRPEISSDPSVVLCVYDSVKDLSSVLRLCCSAYNLTKTETRLVENLVDGLTMSESASHMRIAEATARSYLKQIFAKTETNRQTALVRIMLLSIARTSCQDFCPT